LHIRVKEFNEENMNAVYNAFTAFLSSNPTYGYLNIWDYRDYQESIEKNQDLIDVIFTVLTMITMVIPIFLNYKFQGSLFLQSRKFNDSKFNGTNQRNSYS